jgi:glycosyltransferase involved in cell wall biosynthesis
MNILYIAHERNIGGASKCLYDLACGMAARGHHVYVIVPIKGCNVQKELEKRGITVIPIFFLWWEYPHDWSLFLKIPFRLGYRFENVAVHQISKVIRKFEIDIVHSNSSVIDVGMRAARACRTGHIWHIREFGDLDYQLEFFDGKSHSLQQMNESGSEIIYISERIHQYYQEYISDAHAMVIYDGIDAKYRTDKENEPGRKVIFLVAGYLHRNKRQNLVLQAAQILVQEGITAFEVWIAGKTSAMEDSVRYAEELHRAALEMPDQIRFLGFVSDMIELRTRTDVEIVPSAEEAFGRVTVEAMMAQMPVIGSDSGANPELIRDGTDGYLFESGNVQQLADRMKKLILDRKLIRVLGIQGQARASECFGLQQNLDQLERVYMKISKEKS